MDFPKISGTTNKTFTIGKNGPKLSKADDGKLVVISKEKQPDGSIVEVYHKIGAQEVVINKYIKADDIPTVKAVEDRVNSKVKTVIKDKEDEEASTSHNDDFLFVEIDE